MSGARRALVCIYRPHWPGCAAYSVCAVHSACGRRLTRRCWCRYAFQWWLLPHNEGGAGPGLQSPVFILIPAVTSILAFLMLAAMCVLAIPPIR